MPISRRLIYNYSDVRFMHTRAARNGITRLMEYVTLTFAKKVKMPWPTFRFTGSSTPVTWARTFIFDRMADVMQPL